MSDKKPAQRKSAQRKTSQSKTTQRKTTQRKKSAPRSKQPRRNKDNESNMKDNILGESKMDLEMEALIRSFSLLSFDHTKIIKIQKWFRGCILRLKRLPLIMYVIQKHLKLHSIQFSNETDDGRINSCIDEPKVIQLLIDRFGKKIEKPKIRMWYDILAFDHMYGWLPINIKTTTTESADNTGGLSMCVYAYTDERLDIHKDHNNGKMSVMLYDKIKNKEYNTNNKKDYYFLVLNKTNANDVIVNSVKGLTILKSNVYNLPFQVRWNDNRVFEYANINKKIQLFIDCLQKPKPSWEEVFMKNMRSI